MKKILFLMVFFSIHSAWAIQSSSPPMSPIGYWKTIDDVTGKPQSILQIQPGPNQTLTGRIVRTYSKTGSSSSPICKSCKGNRRNQPIIGMIIMDKLHYDKDNRWINGQILDPDSGNTYHCSIQVIASGDKLNVRGYIGLPLFGRTQTWFRVLKP